MAVVLSRNRAYTMLQFRQMALPRQLPINLQDPTVQNQ